MTRYQVVVTCTKNPCPECSPRDESFLSPVITIGPHTKKRWWAGFVATRNDQDALHRYDVAALRPDGWPLCPWCGEDELYSLALHPSVDTICGCYRCGTTCPEKEKTR